MLSLNTILLGFNPIRLYGICPNNPLRYLSLLNLSSNESHPSSLKALSQFLGPNPHPNQKIPLVHWFQHCHWLLRPHTIVCFQCLLTLRDLFIGLKWNWNPYLCRIQSYGKSLSAMFGKQLTFNHFQANLYCLPHLNLKFTPNE